MSVITQAFKDTITHWPVTGSDTFGGFSFGSAALLEGRWEERQELFVDAEGEQVLSNAVAYLGTTTVNVGDYVTKGDESSVADPGTLPRAYRVRNFSNITDLRGLNTLRRLWL